jgi:cysteine desulfurase
MIYLDNIATTKITQEALSAMMPYFIDSYGNASSIHKQGQKSSEAIEKSRAIIAKKINAFHEEIFFTSGGTESNNMILSGLVNNFSKSKNHFIISNIEHPSVFEYAKYFETKGIKVTYIPVDKDGLVDPGDVDKAISKKTGFVSIMQVNNEIGTIQPLKEIGEICKKKEIYFHSDICQGFTKNKIDVRELNIDLATLNAHKIHGPKGIGALYIKKGLVIPPVFIGGGQENSLRPGTYNTPGIVGFGSAVDIANDDEINKMIKLRDYFINEIFNKVDKVILNGINGNKRICNNINLIFKNVEGKKIFYELNKRDIIISTGSACHSTVLEPSRVILALGHDKNTAHGAIRIGLSKWTTKEELDYTLSTLIEIVKKLRKE